MTRPLSRHLRWLTLILLSLTAVAALAADDLGARKMQEALRVEKAPVIDGKLSDDCWQKASRSAEFWRLKGPAQLQQTFFQLAYDEKNLYLGVTNLEKSVDLLRCEVRVDDLTSVMGDDAIEFFLQPDPPKGDYYQFAANCVGAKYEARDFDSSWNTVWQAAASHGKTEWTLECAVPFAAFGRFGVPGAIWGLNVCRDRQAGGDTEWSAWSPTPGGFHQPHNFGQIVFGGRGGGLDRATLIECARAALRSLELERRLNEAIVTVRNGKLGSLTPAQKTQLDQQVQKGEVALAKLQKLLASEQPLDTRAWFEVNQQMGASLEQVEEAAWRVKFEALLGD